MDNRNEKEDQRHLHPTTTRSYLSVRGNSFGQLHGSFYLSLSHHCVTGIP
jgi:hypothetical protein